jgi:hypothetical protein
MNDQGRVAVAGGGIRVELGRGDTPAACALTVRRLRRSEITDLTRASGCGGDEQARMVLFAELSWRMRIIGAENLTDAVDAQAVRFTTVGVTGLPRPIASREVFDALSDEDLAAIDKACPMFGGGLTETQSGNS